MIQVTTPFLAPKEEYKAYIDKLWDKNWLANKGRLRYRIKTITNRTER